MPQTLCMSMQFRDNETPHRIPASSSLKLELTNYLKLKNHNEVSHELQSKPANNYWRKRYSSSQ